MLTLVARRSRRSMRRTLRASLTALIGATAIFLAFAAQPTLRVAGSDPMHASGWVHWATGYELHGDQTDRHCDPTSWFYGSEGFIRIRMEKRGDTWSDAGSTFRAQAYAFGAPCAASLGPTNGLCWLDGERSWWIAVGRVLDRKPGADAPSIHLDVKTSDGTAWLSAFMTGPEFAVSGGYGGDCTASYPSSFLRLEKAGAGAGTWYTGADASLAGCPLDVIATGKLDATGTRIDFHCLREEHAPTPDYTVTKANYYVITLVDGRVTLTP